jgi:hypothetical protein
MNISFEPPNNRIPLKSLKKGDLIEIHGNKYLFTGACAQYSRKDYSAILLKEDYGGSNKEGIGPWASLGDNPDFEVTYLGRLKFEF